MTALNATSKPTLSAGYTRRRPIGTMTSNALDTLAPEELAWIFQEWMNYTGNEEDSDFNVIMERTTPITNTRIWIVDRHQASSPMVMLPEDY